MRDLTKLTRDQVGRAEWEEICRLLRRGDEWKAKYEETFAFYEDLRKQHDVMRGRLEKCETLCEYAQHYAACTWFEGAIGKPETWICTCGYNAARAALEGK